MFWNDYTSSLFLNLSLQSRWESTGFLTLPDHSMFRSCETSFYTGLFLSGCLLSYSWKECVKNETLLFHFSPPHRKLPDNRERGPPRSTQEHTGHSFCQQRLDDSRQKKHLVFSSVSLFHGVSGIWFQPKGTSVKCFKTKNLQLQDLCKEWVEAWGRYNILKKSWYAESHCLLPNCLLHLFCWRVWLHLKREKQH